MQPQSFYAIDGAQKKTCKLIFVSSSQMTGLPEHEQMLLKTQSFEESAGNLGVIFDTKGNVSQYYIFVENQEYGLALAQAVKHLPEGDYCLQKKLSAQAYVMWGLAQYQFLNYKTHATQQKVRVLHIDKQDYKLVVTEVTAIFLTRDLINEPANILNPEALSLRIKEIIEPFQVEISEITGQALLEENFPAIYHVGKAAQHAPRLIEWFWGDPMYPKIAIVGKGVCFDSGGLNLKPGSGMRLMKKDMGGAAHALALAYWMMALNLPIRLHVLIPIVENAIGPDAYRPSDVLTMRNKKTVEIDNTDAEGRLILADALVKACEHTPELLIDFATLTGAARVAVGTEIAAMFTNSKPLQDALSEVSCTIGDPVWPLPLHMPYQALFHSDIADFANSGATSYAGAITAALFLQQFVDNTQNWVHFDMMAWNVRERPGKPKGGEAMGLQTMAHYLINTYL